MPLADGMRFLIDGYALDFHHRSPAALVVAFGARAERYPPPGTEPAWGEEFLRRRGVSALHVSPDMSCWYRRPALAAFFTAARDAGLFAAFDTVMTYGGSMGGFGALSFSGLAQAQRCLALNPQISLGPSVRSWERRYPEALAQDWDGALCDISVQAAKVDTLALVYDPYQGPDRKQADLVGLDHAIHLHVPFVGHRMPSHLQKMGLLGGLFDQCLAGRIGVADFRTGVRKRRTLLAWQQAMRQRNQNHPGRKARLDRLLPPAPL